MTEQADQAAAAAPTKREDALRLFHEAGADALKPVPIRVAYEGLNRLYVRGLTAGERERLELAAVARANDPGVSLKAVMIVASVCNADGERCFDWHDAPKIAELPAAAVDPVIDQITGLSAITDADLDELAGNSGTPSTLSPGTSQGAASEERPVTSNDETAGEQP